MSEISTLSPNDRSARIGAEKCPGDWSKSPGAWSKTLWRSRPMFDRTRYARLVVRMWLIVARWSDRRLAAAYDRLVDREGGQ